jgi:glycosyltransferase involved in cell wall biosynthesis
MTSGYDLIAYMDYSPASFVFVHLPRWMRGGARTMLHVESTGLKLENAPRMFSLLYRGVLPKCDDYSAITECVARELSASIGRPVRYILPVGVDVQLFSPESERNSSVVTVLFAATLVARKRPLLVLEAAQRFPAVKFRMIGPGRDGYEKLVADRIAELQLKNVTLEGPKSQAEIARAMRESDIFLLPSRTEGLPKVTLEAAASGLPCVVFRDYETPSVIDGVSGFQVGTAEEMMNKLAVLIADASLRERMSIAACKRAAHFEWDRVGPLWQGTYFDILSGGDVSPSLV